ncbi:MAG: hypothetical protein A4E28_01939 [Methanocella sp. PtaU1.Bin125]|nr:MAG: hypothetical protein A4E28_01939 [Methanocella sp. PtaU1.Bin125]
MRTLDDCYRKGLKESGSDPDSARNCLISTEAPLEVTFRIYKDEDGILCATGLDRRLYTFGKTYNKLIKNINDIVELFFGVPYTQVTINLKIEAQGNSSPETSTG